MVTSPTAVVADKSGTRRSDSMLLSGDARGLYFEQHTRATRGYNSIMSHTNMYDWSDGGLTVSARGWNIVGGTVPKSPIVRAGTLLPRERASIEYGGEGPRVPCGKPVPGPKVA